MRIIKKGIVQKGIVQKGIVQKGIVGITDGLPPFPPLSDSVIFEANIEDGVPGTIVAVYNDDLSITPGIDISAFTVKVNGANVVIDGVSIDPVFFDNLLIEFHPPVVHGDFITYQYDARIDPGFMDDVENKPINNVINGVTNLVS